MKRLILNKVKCLVCNTVLQSNHRHHFVECGCSNQSFTDGGLDYNRVGGKNLDLIQNLCEYENYININFGSMFNFKQYFNNDSYLTRTLRPACISIVTKESEQFELNESWNRSLQLVFEDTDDIEDPKCFNEDHAKQILDFIINNLDDIANLQIHCLMGISRSAAIALFINENILNNLIPDLAKSAYVNYNRHIYSTLVRVYISNNYNKEKL